MVTAAKLSWQLRTESCVVACMALRSVDREVVGRNISEREDSPQNRLLPGRGSSRAWQNLWLGLP